MNDRLSPQEFQPDSVLQTPSVSEIRLKLLLLRLKERKKERKQLSVEEHLAFQGRSTVLASDVAQFGKYNAQHTRGEGAKKPHGQLPQYLHDLITFMDNERLYTAKMKRTPTENISIQSDWNVALNGNHRVLALRVLGSKRVKASGMDKWVRINKV